MISDLSGSDHVRRFYRDHLTAHDLEYLKVAVGESDLLVGLGGERLPNRLEDEARHSRLRAQIVDELLRVRRGLRAYIRRHASFGSSLRPVEVEPDAPHLVRQMADAAALAGVGPMAAVAGAIAHAIGVFLADRFGDVVVENGGDVFLHSSRTRTIGIYSGMDGKLSGKLAIRLSQDQFPVGICTSAGTIGPSLSFGSADAVTVISKDPALADAAATSIGNRVASEADIHSAIRFGSSIAGIEGILVVKGDRLGTWGQVELV